MRQYALEKLARSGEEAELRTMHRDYFVGFAEQAAPYLLGPQQTKWLDKLEAEHDNLRVALDLCIEAQGEIITGLGLAGALHRFWFYRAHLAEGRRRYAELLRLDVEARPTPQRALALQGAGNMAYRQGDYTTAREMFEQALAILQQTEDRAKEAELLANLGNIAYFQLNYELGDRLFHQALTLHESAPSPTAALVALHGLGNIAFRTGELSAARELFEQCALESQGYGNLAMAATSQISLGLVQEEEGERAVAHEHFMQALRLFRGLGDITQEMVCLVNLGMVNRKLGHHVQSAQHYREGLQLAEEQPGNRDARVVTYFLEGVAMLAAEAGKPWQAAWLLAAGNALRESIGVPRPPLEKQEFDQDVAEVRGLLDAPSFEAAWSAGEATRVDDAISVALEIVTEGNAF